MVNWPTLRNIKELRSFLGLKSYYWRFIAGYGTIAWPLTQQLKKDAFGWNEDAEKAFVALKHAMSTVPVLALPNFDRSFVIEMDASSFEVRAVLMQDGRTIAFFS